MSTVLVLLLAIIQPARADGSGYIKVELWPKQYDEDGSSPDIKICIKTASNRACDTSILGTCQDKLECTFPMVFPGEVFGVHIYDADLIEDDYIGVAICKGRGPDWRQRTCESAPPIRSVKLFRQ